MYIGCGYYDLATPLLNTERTVNHMLLDPSLSSHVTLGYYEGGHMMYTQLKSLEKIKQDMTKFYTAAGS